MQFSTTLNNYINQKKTDMTELTIKASVIPGFLAAQHFLYAANAEIKVLDNIGKTGSNILKDISNVYCHSIVWLLFTIELAVFVFSKDEKKIGFAKRSAIGCFIVYVVLKLMGADGGIIGTSADTIVDWMSQ